MKDWKFNEVKHGDTVLIMKIRYTPDDRMMDDAELVVGTFFSDESDEVIGHFPPLVDKPLWEIEVEVDIDDTQDSSVVYTGVKDGHKWMKLSIETTEHFYQDMENHVVCIKGKSDDGAEYWAAH